MTANDSPITSLKECMDQIKVNEDKLKVEIAIAKDAIARHEIRVQKIMEDTVNYGKNLIQVYSDKETALKKHEASLMEREKDVESQEAVHQEFKKRKREWEGNAALIKEQNAISDSKVRLNVGGKKFDISVSTLTRGDSGFFDALFSGAWKLDSSKEDGIFIDRDGTLYEYIFNYLRDGTNVVLPEDELSVKRLRVEAEYLGLSEFMKLLAVEKRNLASSRWNRRLDS